ncbi:YdeI/OmpD-associated family protein [Lactiplantibacillus carotarum]|uniref:YdeI/OmpD-associated family protein n=1 Tax=Lactiplantibacillus carotarum TaxID=2993456 RepID=UPI00298F20C0|nr:YdeI/OmpD-associated family protein [Lactiplantibacillus carotarum]
MATKPLSFYEQDIPQVQALLSSEPQLAEFFAQLTPGYQREWARFIFGVQAEATKQRHVAVMKTVFKAGYKSKRAYDSRAK